MCEFALFAFFAEAALVVFADQVADSRPFRRWDVVSVWTGWTSRTLCAVGRAEVGTDWARDFGWAAEGGEGAGEICVEGEGGGRLC